MATIGRYGLNSNGVSVFKFIYDGGGRYSARISASEMQDGDIFSFMGSDLLVQNCTTNRKHKGDSSLNMYECTLFDESFSSESNYRKVYPNITFP